MSGFRNDSAAYDLNLFDPTVRENSTEKTMVVAHNRKSVYARKNAASNIVLAVVITLLFVMLIGSYSTLNEVSASLNSAKKEYASLVDEAQQLEVQFESKINLGKIEDIAVNQYGMEKAQQDDIQYISLMGDDRAAVVKNQNKVTSFLSNLFINIPFSD